MIKREKEILAAYKTLGFSPRDNQLSIVDDIVTSFLDDNMQSVILSANTGVGKSIIAAVVAEVLQPDDKALSSTIYMSSTNSLVDQYADTFSKLPESKFFRVKGASNYPCNYFIEKGNQRATGEDCVKRELSSIETAKYCQGCKYQESKTMMNKTENLITNYAYYFTVTLTASTFGDRNLQVFDEVHLLNEVYCNQVSIEFSTESIDKLCKDLSDMNGKLDNEKADLILFKREIECGGIKHANYYQKLDQLNKIYSSVIKKCTTLAALIPDMKAKSKTKKVGERFARLSSLIEGFFVNKYDHVFDDTVKNAIAIKPIFVGDMMHLLLGRYNLFMSATISPQFAHTTMKLDPVKTAYITADEVFPPENKPIFFLGKENLNYHKLKEPSAFKDLAKMIELIVQHHAGDKGIVITPSFYATKLISDALPKSIKVFQHTQGTNAAEHVLAFRNHTGPAVLISPSIFEGLDLEGDASRFQVIIKAPFAGLGDPRIKKIADKYGSIYREMALYKILQGIGRSIRSSDDYASTYMLDKSIQTLFESKQNIWQDRFMIK